MEVAARQKDFPASFYLTGGTALAAVYYNHRDSEDLDFFSPKQFSRQEIFTLLFNTQEHLKWKHLRRKPGGGEFMFTLYWNDGSTLNLDFVFYYASLFKGTSALGIKVDSLKDIAANKLETILARNQARDYVDLYTIFTREKFSLKQVINWHRKKMQLPTELTDIAAALLKVHEAKNFPKMYIPFSRPKMITFFESLARSLEPEIFK